MKTLTLLFNLLLITCCGFNPKDLMHIDTPYDARYGIDPEIAPHVESFKATFGGKVNFYVGFADDIPSNSELAVGVCVMWTDGYREILIDRYAWEQYSNFERRQLVWHELGHCVYHLEHDDTEIEHVPTSIMNSYMLPDGLFISLYDKYVQQLKEMISNR